MEQIAAIEQLGSAIEASRTAPVFIFKHSTTCPVSAHAIERVNEYVSAAGDRGPAFYMVKVIESRVVSNEIANRLGVQHESPQLILVKDGKAVWDESHYRIDSTGIAEAVAQSNRSP